MSTDFEPEARTPATRRIFRLIRQRPGISRVELAQQAQLSTGTVTQIVKRLRDEGLAREGMSQSAGLGRHRVGLIAESESMRLLGVSVRSDLIRFILSNWSGTAIQERSIALSPDSDPGAVIERFARSLGEEHIVVKAIGLATPSFPAAAREAGDGYAQILGKLLGQPVLVLNNGAAAAMAEEWHWLDHPPSRFLLVYFGAGIGGALVHPRVGGRPPGLHPVEIGHIGIAPDGERCRCGNCGCVELVAAPAMLARRVNGQDGTEQERLRGMAEEAMIYALTSAINVLDVADVILAGLPLPLLERFYGDLTRRLGQLKTPDGMWVRPRLSELGDMSAALGAALAAADAWGGSVGQRVLDRNKEGAQ